MKTISPHDRITGESSGKRISEKPIVRDLSLNGQHPVALSDMTVPQLTAAAKMLDDCQARYDKLSGICATMRGLVLTEVKHKLEHGKFLPWISENFDKTRKTAAQDMRLAGEFFKSNPKVTFETLGRDLATTLKEIDQAQLDLKHPLVREIAGWVGDRTRYQLLLDFPGLGGARTRKIDKDYDPNSEAEAAKDVWNPLMDKLEREGLDQKSWMHLPKKEFTRLKETLLDLSRAVKK